MTILRSHYKFYIDILILLLIPVFLCIFVKDWIFTQAGYVDPFIYFGYFRNFSHHITEFAPNYYGTRLPLILPGYICYKVFSPLIANYVLHLSFYYIAVFSLYFILRIRVNRRVALIMAVLMGFYPYFLASTGWDYTDGAGTAYFLLSLLLLTLACRVNGLANRAKAALLILAGIAFAALIHTNTFLLIMAPSLALYYFSARPPSMSLIVEDMIFISGGLAVMTVLLGAINVVAGGSFLFFIPSLKAAGYFAINPNPFLIPGFTWLLDTPCLVFPSIIFVTGIISVAVYWIKRDYMSFTKANIGEALTANTFNFCHIAIFSLMLGMQLIGNPVFQFPYYVAFLFPTALLAAGAQLAPALSRIGSWQFAVIAAGTIVFLAGSYLLFYHTPVRVFMNYGHSVLYPSVLLIAGIFCLVLSVKLRRPANIAPLVLAFLFTISANLYLLPTNYGQMMYWSDSRRQQEFLALVKSDDALRSYESAGRSRLWYSDKEPLLYLYQSIASTRIGDYWLKNEKFPELVGESNNLISSDPISQGTRIAILSQDENALSMADAALSQIGLHADCLGKEKIIQGSVSFTMTFIRVVPYRP